jgi:hypothetical protein
MHLQGGDHSCVKCVLHGPDTMRIYGHVRARLDTLDVMQRLVLVRPSSFGATADLVLHREGISARQTPAETPFVEVCASDHFE